MIGSINKFINKSKYFFKNNAIQNSYSCNFGSIKAFKNKNNKLERTPIRDKFVRFDDFETDDLEFDDYNPFNNYNYSFIKSYYPAFDFLFDDKRFNISQFKKLTADEKNVFSNKKDKRQELAEECVDFALDIKSNLDDIYGKNNYVFVSVGTSPAMIAKVFECMGIETRYLPISELGTLSEPDELKNDFIEFYGNILKNQGLGKKDVEKSNKKFLFYDYTCSGLTLEKLYYILLEVYNLPSDKLDLRSLNNDLLDFSKNKELAKKYIKKYLLCSFAADFTYIKHLPWDEDIDNTKPDIKKLCDYSNFTSKIFDFYIMNELEKRKLLVDSPLNKEAL